MSEQVQRMFSAIAPKYDAANDVLSFGIHRLWRSKTVELSAAKSGDSVLDCATGTGDLAIEFKKTVGPTGRVVGTDFCADMLAFAPAKAARQNLEIKFEVADALCLPYSNSSFDVASIAFGIRNVDNPTKCLKELARVVRPNGRVVILEFGQPTGLYGVFYKLYSRWIMPTLGQWVTGNRSAYEYLPETASKFPSGEDFVKIMNQAGCFSACSYKSLWFGTAFIYVGTVSP